MRVLITGITGQIGSHLADLLLSMDKTEVFGTCRLGSPLRNVIHLKDMVNVIEVQLEDALGMLSVLKQVRPDRIFHLGAQSSPNASWDAGAATVSANVIGTLNLLEGVRQLGLDCPVVVAGSAAQYGSVAPEEVPVKESQPFRPLSPYGVSKAAAELLAYQYHMNYQMRTFTLRFFNQVGPRQHPRYAIQEFSSQIAMAEAGLQEPIIRVGNLSARRDFTDVRDGVRAVWMVSEYGRPGDVYNLCSQRAPSMHEILDKLTSMSSVPVTVEVDPKRLRVSDEPILLGNNTKLRDETGWEPLIPLESTLLDILNAWRERIRTTTPKDLC